MISNYDISVPTGTSYTLSCKFFGKNVLKVEFCTKKGYLLTLVTLIKTMTLKEMPVNYCLINFESCKFLIEISSYY